MLARRVTPYEPGGSERRARAERRHVLGEGRSRAHLRREAPARQRGRLDPTQPLVGRVERPFSPAFQNEALATRLQIPILYGVDAVHGHGNLQNATIFPHNIGLGATNNPELVEKIGRATAEEMLATGIPWNFSPVVAVVQDVRWGRT